MLDNVDWVAPNTAILQAMPMPASSTTKIPPTLAMEREAAFPLSDFSCELALVRAV